MLSRKGIIVLFTLLLMVLISSAQKEWTLEECIEYALNNNLDIESFEISSESNKERLAQSKRNRLPSVDAGSGYNISFGKSVDPNTNDVTFNSFASNSYSIGGSLTLFNGFVRNNQIAYSRFVYLAGLANQQTRKVEIAFDVMTAFHNSLYFKGLLDIVNEQKQLSELNLEKAKKEVEVGISAKTDILEIEACLADEELLVIRTNNNLKASILELKRIMNYPVEDDLVLQENNEVNLIQSTVYENSDSVYQLALTHLPVVRAKDMELKAVEKSLAIAKGDLYPSLSMSGGYNTGYYETRTDEFGNTISFRDQFKNNASQNIRVGLSIPIFYRLSRRSNIKLYKLNLESKKVELQDFKNQLYYEIESYCQELSAISAEYLQAKKQTESNQLAFNVAERKREQGLMNIIDFYTSKSQLSNAQGELLRTRLEYLIKRKTIDFYLGNPVFGINTMEKSVD